MWDLVALHALGDIRPLPTPPSELFGWSTADTKNAAYLPMLPWRRGGGDCIGCGAPFRAHLHQCEYCKRPQ